MARAVVLGLVALLSIAEAIPASASPAGISDTPESDQYWSPQFRVSPGHDGAERRAPIGASKKAATEETRTQKPPTPAEPQKAVAPLPIPDVDIDAACAKSGLDQAVCVRAAQGYYDRVRFLWDDLSPDGQRHCIAGAADTLRRFPNGYYAALFSFVAYQIDAEQRDRDRVAPPRFQRR